MSLFHVERNPGQLTRPRCCKGIQKPCYCSQPFFGSLDKLDSSMFGSYFLIKIDFKFLKDKLHDPLYEKGRRSIKGKYIM